MQVRTMPELMGRSIGQMRDRKISKKLDTLGKENRRLKAEIDATRGELERERHERVDQVRAVEKRAKKKGRSGGLFRLAAIGVGAYLMGARAGRERYDMIMSKVRTGDDAADKMETSALRLDSPPAT